MFYDIDNCDIASYADDNTPYTSDFNLEEVIQKLELITNNSFEWFKNNQAKKKASRKLHALARVVNFMDLANRKSLTKASQFNYCPLINLDVAS